jgi:GNAT superfamily N-acetyltransferase
MFALPSALIAEGFLLRVETEEDIEFLSRLFASTRADEMAQIVQWTDEQKAEFLQSQFRLQRHHYYTHFPACEFLVLEHDGVPMGRLYLDNRETALDIVDIALLPEWRGRGTGSAIMHAVLDAARISGRHIGLFVERYNPAFRLYTRLGFREIEDHGIYIEMVWRADAPVS